MRLRVLGINLQMGKGIFFQDFLTYLSSLPFKPDDDLILAVRKRDEYWVGVLVTIRDSRTFCKLIEDGGSFTVTAEQLEQNESPIEFNFFLFNSATGRGLYQYHRHSATANSFATVLKSLYNTYKEKRIADDLKTGEKEDDVRAKYAKSLRYSVWLKPDGLAKMLDLMERIRTVEVEFESFDVDEGDTLRPLSKNAKSVVHRFRYSADSGIAKIKSAIRSTLTKNVGDLLDMKVSGVDPAGNEVLFKLENNIDYLTDFDYDEVAKDLELSSKALTDTLVSSAAIDRLIGVAQSPHVRTVLKSPQKID